MSWNKQRVYKCDVCGKLQPVSRYNHGAPAFWRHTGNRHRFTICDECRDAIRWAANARKKERAERSKAALDAFKRKMQEQEQEQGQEQGQERYGGLVGALQTMLYGGPSDGKEEG